MELASLQSRRTWIVGGAVIALLVAAVGWFLIVGPKLGDAADHRAQTRANDFANTQLLARHGVLARQEGNIASLRSDLVAALAALPPTSALPEFTNEATQAAATSAVTLQNITVGALAPVTSTTPTAPTAAASGSTETPAATTTPSAAPAGSPASAAQYQLGITLTTSGKISDQLAFLKAIQNGSRRALITSTSLGGDGSKLVLTTQLNIFTAPMSAQQVAQLRTLLATG